MKAKIASRIKLFICTYAAILFPIWSTEAQMPTLTNTHCAVVGNNKKQVAMRPELYFTLWTNSNLLLQYPAQFPTVQGK